MKSRRLGWSGIEVECDGATLLIDYIQDTTSLPLRDDAGLFPPSSQRKGAAVALVTHLHSDHADAPALKQALRPGAPIFRPAPAEGASDDLELTARAEVAFSECTLGATVIQPGHELSVGPFRMTPVPAVDGFGDPQYTWVVECGNRRFIHGGDTLFHGYWWRIGRRFSSFDIAFLPINAPLVDVPFLQPASTHEVVMSPEEAIAAAHILRASTVVPIHYHDLHRPPIYRETPNATERLRTAGTLLNINVTIQSPGDWVPFS